MGKFVCWVACLIFLVGCATIPLSDRVYCPKCHKQLSKYFEVCPRDNAPLNGYKYWFWSRGRSLPKMAYQAETYLIKKNGVYVWYPYEVDLIDPGK